MKTVYKSYEDPGHGWLAVPRDELARLGIMDKISSYSYQRRGMVYLEEDGDLSAFMDAKRAAGETVTMRGSHTDSLSRIRNYDRFSPTTGE